MELLLGLEDADEEELLQLLVGKVDAELLERVSRKRLEAENVDGADKVARLAAKHERLVGRLHNLVEELRVERTREGVDGRGGGVDCLRLGDPIEARLDVERAERLDQQLGVARQQLARLVDRLFRHDGRVVLARAGELDVAQVQDGLQHLPDALAQPGHRRDQADRLEQRVKVARELLPLEGRRLGVQVLELVDASHLSLRRQVKDVIVLLPLELGGDARLLEEVGADVGALHPTRRRELQRQELTEAAAVVVADRLGAPKRLHDRVGLQHAHVQITARLRGDGGEVLEQNLGGLGLAGARLARDDHRLADRVLEHSEVRRRRDSIDVRSKLRLRLQ
mmetsp:Transcript_29018/g.76937  ORF Transcript_29018/g.76937 Transcript_29018/m.76937 type:complete len:338 (-) Transcript_29018:312-1325(-)